MKKLLSMILKMSFIVKKCNKKYKTKNYLTIHEKNCTGLSIFTCPKCKKTFSTRQSKSAHIKNNKCKELIINNTENNKPIININGNNNNNITNNYIKFDDIIKILLNSGDFIIPRYIELKHFNEKYPENHNIKYERNRGCIIRENYKWKYTNIDYLSNDLLNKNSNELRSYCNKEKDKIENEIRNLELIDFIYSRLSYLDLSMDKIEIKNIIKSTLFN
jgi:transposase-like protein